MSAATITQAQESGLRRLTAAVRNLATGLFAAHGGWQGRASLKSLATDAQQHSPSLSAELRYLASRG